MKNKKTSLFIILILISTIFTGTILNASPAYSNGDEEHVFVFGTLGNVLINPITSFTYGMFRSVLYTTLFIYDENLEPQPWLGTGFEQIDSTTWRVNIREDAKWHDGEPITSADVKFTIDLVLEAGGVMSRFVGGIESVGTPDDHTVKVKTSEPTLVAPWLTSVYILPKHYWEGEGAVGAQAIEFANNPPIGSGPFKFVSWSPGEKIEFEAFEDFFLGRPHIDRLIWVIYASPEPMIAALKAGEIDAADRIPIKTLRELESVEGITTETVPGIAIYNVYFNQAPADEGKGNPALLDLNVRQAIWHAIDKEFINEQVYDGRSFPGLSIIPPTYAKFHCDECIEVHPEFDLNKAAQILDDSGYVDTDEDGIREDPISGQPLAFRWWTAGSQPEGIRMGEIIKDWFNEIGMDLSEIRSVEGGSLWDSVTVQFNYDLVYWNWAVQDESSILYSFTSGASGEPVYFSSSQYRNPEFDAIYENQLQAQTNQERIAAIKDAQRHIIENAVELIMFYPPMVSAWWDSKWTGNVPNPTGSFDFGNLNSKMFLNVEPIEEEPEPTETGIDSMVYVIAGAIIVIVVGLIAVIFLRRRK
jgi:peptide/nickel transport system substrate-binding protein